MKKLRVAFFETRYDSFYGAQQSMFTLIANLDRYYFEPYVITTAESIFARRFREAGINVHVLPMASMANMFGKRILHYPWWKKILVAAELLRYNFHAFRWLHSRKIDVVYANDIRALLYVGLTSRLMRLMLVWCVRGDERLG
ncbi:MAG: hypothetical protein IBX64_13920, partial [Actinobacteria bacterium]|nr:hypothetical protein [Actinomycetota bacterium]